MKKNTKTKVKAKTIKRKKKQQKYLGEKVYFEIILMVILIPVTVLFLIPIFNKPVFKKSYKPLQKTVYMSGDRYSAEITTEKNVYRIGDKITLSVKNNSNSPIYFKPCEYLNNFEKRVNGVWVAEKGAVENEVYDSSNFKREESVTSCNVDLPKSGVGIYRAVVKVYYNCQIPGGNKCSNSKTFYSNEFIVKAADFPLAIDNKNDFCEDKVLENCDGKRVSVIGTFITSKAHFLSGIEDRIVEHQWAGGIIIDNPERMKEGGKYKVVGVIRKGGQPCGLNNEQCMLDERGVVLPYPASIEVEKVYLVE